MFLKVYGPLEQYIVFPLLIEIQVQETFTCILIWTCWLRFGLTVWETLWSRKDFGELKNKYFWGGPLLLGLSSGSNAGCRAQCCQIFWCFRSSEIWIFMWKLLSLTSWKLMCSFYKQHVSQVKYIWGNQNWPLCPRSSASALDFPLWGRGTTTALSQLLTWWQGEAVGRKRCVDLWWSCALARGNLWICEYCHISLRTQL